MTLRRRSPPPSRVAAVLLLLCFPFLASAASTAARRPCQDSVVNFYPDLDSKDKAKCTTVDTRTACSSDKKKIVTAADHLCPITCGKCTEGKDEDLPCEDAPSPAHVGWTRPKDGSEPVPKTCEWIAGPGMYKACGSNKYVAALCPVTCGLCAAGAADDTGGGGDAPLTTTAKPAKPATSAEKPELPEETTPTAPAAAAGPPAGGSSGRPPEDDRKHKPAQIMMYWEDWYFWQQEAPRTSWCLECRDVLKECPPQPQPQQRQRRKKRRRRLGYGHEHDGGEKEKEGEEKKRNRIRRKLPKEEKPPKEKKPRGECKAGAHVSLAECDASNILQKWIWDHGTIRPETSPNLCVERGPLLRGKWYSLQKCNGQTSSTNQHFFTSTGYNTNGIEQKDRFEIHPDMEDGTGRSQCVTQHHQPMCGEKIKHDPCDTFARKHKTSYWVADEEGICGHDLAC